MHRTGRKKGTVYTGLHMTSAHRDSRMNSHRTKTFFSFILYGQYEFNRQKKVSEIFTAHLKHNIGMVCIARALCP